MRKFLLKIIFLTGLLACWGGAMAQTSFSANFDNNQLPADWVSSKNYKLTTENGALTIAASKGPWDQFEVGIGTVDASTKTVVSFKVKAQYDCFINVGIISGTAGYSVFPVERAKLVGNGEFMDVAFDFTGKVPSGVNAGALTKIVIIVNPAYRYRGYLYIDDFNVGTTAKKFARVHMPVEQILATGGANKVTQIKGISTGVTISAVSSSATILPNPTVGAVSGGVASITFAPSASNHGESMVTLTLTGDGFDATTAMFKVIVNNNIAPVINPILDANLGSGIANEILISGINDGNPEVVQTLTVTATSSDLQTKRLLRIARFKLFYLIQKPMENLLLLQKLLHQELKKLLLLLQLQIMEVMLMEERILSQLLSKQQCILAIIRRLHWMILQIITSDILITKLLKLKFQVFQTEMVAIKLLV